MQPEVLKLLTDMRDAASDVASFVAGQTVDDFLQDFMGVDEIMWPIYPADGSINDN